MNPIVFCACEKIIIDRTTGGHSLIGIMISAEARFAGTPPALPPNAVVPNMWFVYAMWETSTEDIDRPCEQVLEVDWPNGERFIHNRLSFTPDKTLRVQNSVGMVGFPLGQNGDLRIRAWIEREGESVSSVAEYQVSVKHPEQLPDTV